MKKITLMCLICVIFYAFACSVGQVFCFSPEHIEFFHNQKVFTYRLENNLKTSSQFDLNYEINKHDRFGSKEKRIMLLKNMLSLGFDKAVALDYIFPNLTKKIDSIAKNVFIAPKDAVLKINPQSENVFIVSQEIVGTELDKKSLIDQICHDFISNKKMQFQLPTKSILPTKTKNDYEKFTNLRADFSTNISSSSESRKHNIKNALKSLNKIEIAPNEIFSFNKIVGKRTPENGYREAKIIVNNEFVEGVGGGVCQVSSTLYNSALLAGLEIIEANKHSKQVGYVKYGFDAMVNFGSSDLKFRNNTNEKLTIITNYSSSTARIRIFGEHAHNTFYKLTNEILNITEPNEEIIIDEKGEHINKVIYDDEFFYLKNGNRGMEIKTYREKYVNNILVSKELLRHDKFKVQNSIKVFGNKKRNSDVSEQEKSAELICA